MNHGISTLALRVADDRHALREQARWRWRRGERPELQHLFDHYPWLGREMGLAWHHQGAPVTIADGAPLISHTERDWLDRLPDVSDLQVRGLRVKPLAEGARLRLFACDCAEYVLSLFEARHPDDKRPRQAIEAARRFATGRASAQELDAAWDAAWDAAALAADAARAAAWAAAGAAWKAAWNAAWAAREAAWAAARDARAAEATPQENLLVKHLLTENLARCEP